MPPALHGVTQAVTAHPGAAAALALSALLAARLARFLARDDADAALLRARPPRPGSYARKTVWITGASQGLGRELALRYARLGAKVLLSARPSPRLDAAVAAVASAAVSAGAPPPVSIPFDATAAAEDLAAAAAAAAAASTSGLGPDLLVLCAGASQHAAAAACPPAVTDALFDLNAAAPVRLISAALPGLLAAAAAAAAAAGGTSSSSPSSILAISSIAALVAAPGQAAYGASKAGLGQYVAALSAELADANGFKATVFMPGPIGTGTEAAPRAVFGSAGPKRLPPPSPAEAAKRLSPGRAADLAVTAAHAGLPVAWAARQPVLALAYLAQYAPWAATRILRAVGPARAAGLEAGRGGYDVGGLARAAATHRR